MKDSVLNATKHWVENTIIKHNFCPFAKPEVKNDRIRYHNLNTSDISKATQASLDECLFLLENPEHETSLMVFSQGFNDFNDFLDLIDVVNHLIDQSEMRETFQIAHFHPDYLFAGECPNSPSHFTNRSPYPTLHIIRQASIEHVMKGRSESDDIVARNIAKCEELGWEQLASELAASRASSN